MTTASWIFNRITADDMAKFQSIAATLPLTEETLRVHEDFDRIMQKTWEAYARRVWGRGAV